MRRTGITLIVVGLAMMIAGCGPKPHPEKYAGISLWRVEGTSMEPVLMPGDVVITDKTPYEQLKMGDVCVYINALETNGTVTHRIVGGWAGEWVMKGDNNPTTDAWIMTKDRFVARAAIVNGRILK